MGHSYLRPFIGVGIAYFLIAVLGAGTLSGKGKEKGYWSAFGVVLSFLAGAVGALGALGVILALAFGGKPIFVMPMVFGGAPVVNTLVTSYLGKTYKQITPLFVIGMVLVAFGMVGVLINKPTKAPTKPAESATTMRPSSDAIQSSTTRVPNTGLLIKSDSVETKTAAASDSAKSPDKAEDKSSTLAVVLSIIFAAVCWGSYGPFLHLGQMRMGGSRLRPFVCVGLAYFVVAIIVPLMLITANFDKGGWTWEGMIWSIAAGTAGAIGAFGIILAFNSGGKPVFVMPLVFGFAPVINTLTSMWLANTLSQISPVFVGALATSIAGAVMVLVFAPKPKHGPASPSKPEPKPDTKPLPAGPTGTSGTTSTAVGSTTVSTPSTATPSSAPTPSTNGLGSPENAREQTIAPEDHINPS